MLSITVKTLPKYGKNCIALFNNAHKRFIKAEGNKRNITQSPRRGHFNETNEIINQKVKAVLKSGLISIP